MEALPAKKYGEDVTNVYNEYRKRHATWVTYECTRSETDPATPKMAHQNTIAAITGAPWRDQIQFFMNAYYFDFNGKRNDAGVEILEAIWKYAQKWEELDRHQWENALKNNPKNYNYATPSLEEVYARQFIQHVYAEEKLAPLTAIQINTQLAEKIDANKDGKLGFIEFLLWHYKKSPEDLTSKYQLNNGEIAAAYQKQAAYLQKKQAWDAKEAALQDAVDNATGVKKGQAVSNLAAHKQTSEALAPEREAAKKAVLKAKNAAKANRATPDSQPYGPYTALGAKWWLAREYTQKIKLLSKSAQKKHTV